MSKMFEDLKEGLEDAIKDAKSSKKFLRRNKIHVEPLVDFKPFQIKEVRNKLGMTQVLFARYLGVSEKTVEAWECGINKPSGSSNRLITMMKKDNSIVKKFPFISM